MGRAWTEWTGKPFVYAVWALGPDVPIDRTELERFRGACREGVGRRAEMARDEKEREYLMHCIRYGLGVEEKEGLAEFAQRSGLGKVEIEWL